MPTDDEEGGIDALRLEVADFTNADHWRWLLTDPDGNFLADHQVALDRRHSEYVAFADLAAFLRRQADPGRRLASEAELVARVGRWIGEQVIGEAIRRAMVEASPVVVRVVVPLEADFLLYRPLELAQASAGDQPARPLAVQDVSLVFEVQGKPRGWSSTRSTSSCVSWRYSACPARVLRWRCAGNATSWSGWSGGSRADPGGR